MKWKRVGVRMEFRPSFTMRHAELDSASGGFRVKHGMTEGCPQGGVSKGGNENGELMCQAKRLNVRRTAIYIMKKILGIR